MKRAILFFVINFLALSQSLNASLAHMPANLAYTIAGYANAMLYELADENDDTSAALIEAVRAVKQNYESLGSVLEAPYASCDDAAMAMSIATAALEDLSMQSAAQLPNLQAIITRMLAHNERLSADLS